MIGKSGSRTVSAAVEFAIFALPPWPYFARFSAEARGKPQARAHSLHRLYAAYATFCSVFLRASLGSSPYGTESRTIAPDGNIERPTPGSGCAAGESPAASGAGPARQASNLFRLLRRCRQDRRHAGGGAQPTERGARRARRADRNPRPRG